MIEILEFVFSSFWTWLGTVILIGTVSTGISVGVRMVRSA